MRRTFSATLVTVGVLAGGASVASAARGPLLAPTGMSGGLRAVPALRVAFPVPPSFGTYETIDGAPVDGAFLKEVPVGARTCRIALRVQGRMQRSRPTRASLTQDDFVATTSGHTATRRWSLGHQAGDWLAYGWRTATPSTRRYGAYVAVTAFVSSDPSEGTTCDAAIAAERTAALTIARRWTIVRTAAGAA